MGCSMHGADPQITTTVLEGLDDVLRAHPGCNFSLDALLDAVGIARPADPSVDGMPHNISLNKYAELLELAAQKTGDDCFGLHFAQAFPPGATGIFGFIMLNAPDVRTMVRCVTRFAKLSIEALDVAFEEQDGMAEITWTFSPLLVA